MLIVRFCCNLQCSASIVWYNFLLVADAVDKYNYCLWETLSKCYVTSFGSVIWIIWVNSEPRVPENLWRSGSLFLRKYFDVYVCKDRQCYRPKRIHAKLFTLLLMTHQTKRNLCTLLVVVQGFVNVSQKLQLWQWLRFSLCVLHLLIYA